MKRERDIYDAADDLWTVTVSFVLYLTLLLVIYKVQAEEGQTPMTAGGWRLQDLAALVMSLWGASNLLAFFVRRRKRWPWLVVGVAQVLGADGLYRMREEDWLWVALTSAAIICWVYAFQVCITAALSGGFEEEEPAPSPDPAQELNVFCGIIPPGEEEEEPAGEEDAELPGSEPEAGEEP